MSRKMRKNFMLLTLLVITFMGMKKINIEAASKSYGLVITNIKGKSTYYDLNGVKGVQRIECTTSKKIMMPVKKVCSYIPVLSYNYNWDTSKATIENKNNGKKIILTNNSQYMYTYASQKTKAKRVKLAEKCYLSKGSNALMVEVSAFKYVFSNDSGYKHYSNSSYAGKKAIKSAGFNSSSLQGIIVYNPYKAVKSLPSATAVKYVSEKDLTNIVKVTIPEGYSVAQIADLMVSRGVCQSTSAFLSQVNAVKPSSYWFINTVKKVPERCFYIEGYLYPSTYEFYKNTSPTDVIAKILKNTENQYKKEYVDRAKQLGYTLDQVITVASIIEKEVANEQEQPNVASVLYNRLEKGMKIQCDATIHYVERYIKPYISGDINRYNSYYNTYKCKQLPSGPICNPGMKALHAALYPNDTDFLYFCSDKKGNYYYAATYEEHLENVKKIN